MSFVLPSRRADQPDQFDVAIVGAGPGGMTAAIYCSRARLATVVLERNTAGGIMAITERIENYPGFPEGITGFDLSEKMKQQAAQFGADLREITTVAALDRQADGSWIVVTDEERIAARAIILSPGVEARKLGVPGEAEFMGRGVSYCATCDGALYRDKEVVVIGGGDSAVEEGMFLAKFASAVHVIHRRDELRAQKIAQERAFANPRMHFIWNSQVRRIVGDTKVEGVDYQNVVDKAVTTLPVSGVFFYVGQLPNTNFLQGVVDLDEGGYVLTDAHLRTSQPGVLACGDARAGLIKQIANAVGEGALAAIETEKYLDTLEPVAQVAPAAESADTTAGA
ncbi:MAG TPA: thioredoxin-disulfide reductase [Thermoleophilia bacterium]|nr:thioredoxin-disulfide reductase [Thermoleophilia bacterium]